MYNGLDKPLFGEARPRDRYFNYVVGAVTVILVCETLISSLALHFPPKAINVFLASIISMICISELILIYWYRQGDVDPKFRKLIYFNSFTTILLCICANVYYYNTTA
ncbi:transmembrane protein 243-like [Pocillopora verrucosa]|uniref:transmembrane protein 243-like n=1 Tax=Pocillopora verrucosa TaxID=203993 RepID=UPI003341135D